MIPNLRRVLSRVVGKYGQKLGQIEQKTRESYRPMGRSPSGPECEASILRQSLELIEPELVDRFLSKCADEAVRQLKHLEAGIPRTGIVNPYSEAHEQCLLQEVKDVLERLKKKHAGSLAWNRGSVAAVVATIEAKVPSLNFDITDRFDTERREFDIQVTGIVRKTQASQQGGQKSDGASAETVSPKGKSSAKKATRDERNAEARRYLGKHRDREKLGKTGRVSARELTQHLKKVCGTGSTGGLTALPVWVGLQQKRNEFDEAKRKVKTRSLTAMDLDNLQDRDSELKRLAAEQAQEAKQDRSHRRTGRNR